MAGLFSLGGGGGGGSGRDASTSSNSQNQNQNTGPGGAAEGIINPWGGTTPTAAAAPPGVVLYRNEEIYQKGFEIWQQYVQVHHHHHPAAAAAPIAVPPNLNHPHFHHQHHHPVDPTIYGIDVGPSTARSMSYSTTSRSMRSSSVGAVGGTMMMGSGSGSGSGSGGGINCQDCGNQAKKDCAHMRCRTCCKSRGFECPTHVKSTWVPAAKRRERQQQLAALQQGGGGGQHHQQQQGNIQDQGEQHSTQHQQHQVDVMMRGAGEKRLRGNNMSIVIPPSRFAAPTSTGLELGQNFPSEVSSPAVFRCVRVSSINDAEEHLAYQTAVSIAGHVFKGILYDQGPERSGGGDESPPGSSGGGGLQQHNLLTGIGIATNAETSEGGDADHGDGGRQAGGSNVMDSAAAAGIYPTPINAFLASTQFFPPPRS